MPLTSETPGRVLYLTDMLGTRVTLHGKKIGRLADLVIVENHHLPKVTTLYVRRPYGDPSLLIPWAKVKLLDEREVVVTLEDVQSFEGEPSAENDILLRDHILDKKVIDTEDREVEIVYDIKLMLRNNTLYVTDVNISRYRLLRRLGLKWFAKFLYSFKKEKRDEKIPWTLIQPLPADIDSFRGDVKLTVLKEKLSEIHPADLADILEELEHPQRVALFRELDPERASDTLEQIDPSVQRDLIPALDKRQVARLLSLMTSGQAADILSALPREEARIILPLIQEHRPEHARKIEAILGKQEERVVNYTTSRIIRVGHHLTAQEARDRYFENAKDKEVIMYLYVVDDAARLIGVLDLKELLVTDPSRVLKDAMIDRIITLKQDSTLKDALELFNRYDFRALPVVDGNGVLLGALTHRDVISLRHRFWDWE
ncbi:MAG: CBS domain-containing protein [Candidatus Peribacteraceae bacterium]|nr:CBS domain-containing protein [Candidatus Peribacteraceae bacterium]MDD5739883.1 CBS domain-containing protein [Candidatus Peribacteraceae bacterium]